MTSPPNTQDMLACMNDALVQVAVYFEGKTKEVEVPCGGADGQLFLSELRDVVEDGGAGGASSSAAASSAAINFFSVGPQRLGVGNGELGKNVDPGGARPLSAAAALAAARRDGMLVAARCGDDREAPAKRLIADEGIEVTVDVTPSCSILLNGGVDYDLPTALAELVDNSIAALGSPAPGEPKVCI